MRAALLLAAAAALAWPGWAQDHAGGEAVFQVDYTNPEISPSHWTMTLHPDGSGHFSSEVGAARTRGIEAPSVDRDIQVSAEFAGHVFDAARRHNWFNMQCESRSHEKMAFQGRKRFSYSGPEGSGACEFEHAKDPKIDELGASLEAVAGTIVEGARLESLMVHDRLGLDDEMEFLVEASRDGRIQQIGTIREILERVAQDDQVMDRVRQKARDLLAQAQSQVIEGWKRRDFSVRKRV